MMEKMCYTLSDISTLALQKKQDDSVLLFKKDFEDYNYEYHKMLGWVFYPNICFATIINKKIVSCASIGYNQKHQKNSANYVEISTVTNEAYRGKGYAVSNVVALCDYITKTHDKTEVFYITDDKNIASCKTALSAGLTKVNYSYILLRKTRSKLGMPG